MRIALAFALTFTVLAGVAHAGPLAPNLDPNNVLLAQYYPPQPPPPPQPYYQPAPMAPPPGARPAQLAYEERPRWGLFIAGMIVWGVFYSLDVGITNATGHGPLGEAFIPVAGPLFQMGDSFDDESSAAVAKTFLTFDFLLQATGATMAILGLVVHKRVVVYADGETRPVQTTRIAFGPQHFAVTF